MADSRFDVRISGDHGAIFLEKIDGPVFQHHRGKEGLEYVWRKASGNYPKELARGSRYLAGKDQGSPLRNTAVHQFDQDRLVRQSILQLLKVMPVCKIDRLYRPLLRRVDVVAVRIEDIDTGKIGRLAYLRLQMVVILLGNEKLPQLF